MPMECPRQEEVCRETRHRHDVVLAFLCGCSSGMAILILAGIVIGLVWPQ